MFIPVILKGGEEDLVSKRELQSLLVKQRVLSFMRSDGWAVVGRDKMRKHKDPVKEKDRRGHDVYK